MTANNGNELKQAVFLDRDGTIIEDRGHLSQAHEVQIYPFALKALKMLGDQYQLFIVTNQSGVGLGKISKESVKMVNSHLLSQLKAQGIIIQELYCCYHKRDDNCECIKPKPYFLRRAELEFGIDIPKSYTIGDHPHDADFGNAAGATGIYVLTGHGRNHYKDLAPDVMCFENLLNAAEWILAEKQQRVSNTLHRKDS